MVPRRTADPREARELVAVDGAAILTGCGEGEVAARGVATAVFGDEVLAVPPAAPIRPGPETEGRLADDGATPSLAHTDGFAYGDALPDHFLLLVDRQCSTGGANFLVDGYAVLDALAAAPETAAIASALSQVAVDQTEEGMHEAMSPIVLTGPSGRRVVRRTPAQAVPTLSDTPLRDASLIGAWHAAVDEAAARAEPFRVEDGEAVIVDNQRMLHGRGTYESPDRSLWRVWVWTAAALAVPEGALHSDRRLARVARS